MTDDECEADVVFLDVQLPDGNGLDLLPTITECHANPEVIIITGAGDPDGAELAINSGAWDYIEKSSSLKSIVLSLNRAIEYRKEKSSTDHLVVLKRNDIIGSSPKIMTCLDLVAQSAMSDVNVLISGETGTGKELFAWAIHNNSRRAENNFVVVDCAALPDTLVESILLGHKKGAFTGAEKDSEGLFRQADKGTIFLDEIGELSLANQRAFLRVLQEQKFRPVGSREEVASNFRVVAATNRDLQQLVAAGNFRRDLYYRIKTVEINIPSLKERRDDIKDLVNSRVANICERYGFSNKGISSDYYDVLADYDWPGNVRELFNVVDSSVTSAKNEPIIYPKHLPSEIHSRAVRSKIKAKDGKSVSSYNRLLAGKMMLREYRDMMDKHYLQELMHVTGSNIREACAVSGLSRSRLYALLQKHEISPDKGSR